MGDFVVRYPEWDFGFDNEVLGEAGDTEEYTLFQGDGTRGARLTYLLSR